ncbi:hypothetical protein DRQ32_10850 [bacterium]|nr:MAG: hypothetical protein DRQ32_10850 [bacterium]
MNKRSLLHLLFTTTSLVFIAFSVKGQTGEEIFKKTCSACHTVGRGPLVGPDLAGVTDRRSEEWILEFVTASQALIKSGDADAVAIFEEFNKIPMPDQSLSSEEFQQLLEYIVANSPDASASSDEEAEPVEVVPFVPPTQEEIEHGGALFAGRTTFSNGGPSCISCHHATNNDGYIGGILAKDLTKAHERMGDAGIKALLGSPPFPAMTTAYEDNVLEEQEISDLAAYLYNTALNQKEQANVGGYFLFLTGGGIGLLVLLAIIYLIWAKRIKYTVKREILDRQLKSI